MSQTLGGAIGLNWLQFLNIQPNSSIPSQISSNPSIDPIAGGLGTAWADNIPWYWHTTQPNNLSQGIPDPDSPSRIILPNGKKYEPAIFIDDQLTRSRGVGDSLLNFSDYPGGPIFPDETILNFSTFLVAEFPNKEYDTLGGFTWTARVDQEPDKTYTDILSLEKGAMFNAGYADLVSAFGDGGYTKVLRLPTYQYSRNLSPGAVHNFDIAGLPVNSGNYLAWTNNQLPANPTGQPDTRLGIENSGGFPFYHRYLYARDNDDGGPYEDNKGSGLRGRVNSNGTVRLKVSGSEDHDFDGKVYKDSICVKRSGGSGGGGCVKYRDIEGPHSESGKYDLLVKLYETNFPDSDSSVFKSFFKVKSFSSASLLSDLPASDELQAESSQKAAGKSERVPEPTLTLGLLALGAGGILVKLTCYKDE
ncbi:MAG: hypothetical protein SW833_19765 [Cyanobacteriota bacterium]|nr:hypothetical protein [Cyanobacteriota bacterium]